MGTFRLLFLLTSALIVTRVSAQTEEIVYVAKLPMAELNNSGTSLPGQIRGYNMQAPLTVSFQSDRIELTFKGPKKTTLTETIFFKDQINQAIQVIKIMGKPARMYPGTIAKEYTYYVIRLSTCDLFAREDYYLLQVGTDKPAGDLYLGDTYHKMNIQSTESNFKALADKLFFFQHQYNIKLYDSLITEFKPVAAKYCSLVEKPTISEEQRRFIVQANVANEQKMYSKAIELYKKAIELDETAFPAAYLNLALLSAQVNNFDAAIFNMKKYLLIEPDAPDARSAMDKIYEWEIIIQK